MSKIEKLIARLLSRPSDFTYDELVKVLAHFGYSERTGGKTGGSRRAFVHEVTLHIIRLHKPHPRNLLKRYQIDEIIDSLEKQGLL